MIKGNKQLNHIKYTIKTKENKTRKIMIMIMTRKWLQIMQMLMLYQ